VSETCRAKNTSIKLPCCIKLAFHIIFCLLQFELEYCQFPEIRKRVKFLHNNKDFTQHVKVYDFDSISTENASKFHILTESKT